MAKQPTQPKAQRPTARMSLGRRGEQIAADWLTAHGLRIVARNWRCPYGELDLIVEESVAAGVSGESVGESEIVAVEVKTRRGEQMGAPEEAITPVKSRRLVATIQSYLIERGVEQAPYRIDVIAVQLAPSGKLLDVRHYRSAVTLDG